jgi:cytochrome c553
MLPFAQGLQNQDIKDVSAFLATLPVPTQKKPQNASVNAGNKQNGYRYYQSKCGACHGELGQGNSAFKAPRLTGLSAVYLQRQMDHFRTGVRGAHHADKLGRQMAMMAKLTSGQDLADILLYLEQQ